MTASLTQLAILRADTERFINLDPSEIVLTPRTEQFLAGTKTRVAGVPKPTQTFKIIWSGSPSGFVSTINGETRRFDFILVGNYDANVAIGDFWLVGKQDNEIEYIFPPNGYEIKCGGSSHGSSPHA